MPIEITAEQDRDDDVVVSLAVTLDGYISRANGDVDYLEKYPIVDFDFDGWVARIGALVMGRTSYEQTVGWGWTWGDRPTLVLTNSTDLPVPDGADITFSAAPTGEAIQQWSEKTPGRLWVFGGGMVVTDAMVAGVVDTLDIVVMPEAIGDGIPLFTKPFDGPMRVISSTPFDNGAIRLVYDLSTSGVSPR